MQVHVDVHISNFGAIAERLAHHNREFSARMNEVVLGNSVFFASQFSSPQSDALGKLRNPESDAQDIFSKYSRTLASIGLGIDENRSLRFARQHLDRISDRNSPAQALESAHRLDFEMVDSELLVRFLDSINPHAAKGRGVATGLTLLSQSLDTEVVGRHRMNMTAEEKEEFKRFTSDVGAVATRLLALDQSPSAQALARHVGREMMGDLSEYLIAEKLNVFGGVSLGPENWHRHFQVADYESRWSEALSLLRIIGRNDQASELYRRTAEHLAKCAKAAAEEMSASSEDPRLRVIRTVRRKLDDLMIRD